jgi:hypothetical protein
MPILGVIASSKLTAEPNSYESIDSAVLVANGAITFSSIPQTFKHLQLRGITKANTPGNNFDGLLIRVGNGSDDTGSNYTNHQMFANDNSTVVAGATFPAIPATYSDIIYTTGGNATSYGPFVMDILDYSNTNKFKTMKALSGAAIGAGGFAIFRTTGWMSTSAINIITISVNGFNLASGTEVGLYGIKG